MNEIFLPLFIMTLLALALVTYDHIVVTSYLDGYCDSEQLTHPVCNRYDGNYTKSIKELKR